MKFPALSDQMNSEALESDTKTADLALALVECWNGMWLVSWLVHPAKSKAE
jgi:hypothetical protein